MNGASAIPWANTMGDYHELLPCATITSYYIVVVVGVLVVVVVVVVESTCVWLDMRFVHPLDPNSKSVLD